MMYLGAIFSCFSVGGSLSFLDMCLWFLSNLENIVICSHTFYVPPLSFSWELHRQSHISSLLNLFHSSLQLIFFFSFVFFPVSIWIVCITMPCSSLIFSCVMSNLLLIPLSIFFILNIIVLISKNSFSSFLCYSCPYLIFSVYEVRVVISVLMSVISTFCPLVSVDDYSL